MRRQNAVRLGVPALVVTVLAVLALWRVGAPVAPSSEPASAGDERRQGPLTAIADILTTNATGRQASLERVEVREVTSARTFWFGPSDGERVFAVLDPDVRRTGGATTGAGELVTLVGLVRPSPPPEQATRQWQLDEATAREVEERGVYLHVTEVRPAG